MRTIAVLFQSTHPVWGATATKWQDIAAKKKISIHAPRVGCDGSADGGAAVPAHFNPRTPCGVRRSFLAGWVVVPPDFNPRTPCGVRQVYHVVALASMNFNPRTPCGVRPRESADPVQGTTFQSTHPVWGATRWDGEAKGDYPDFNPRTPCGVRLTEAELDSVVQEFQSTHPVWGAT